MPTLDEAVQAFAARHHWPIDRARAEADRQIEVAVSRALGGNQPAFEQCRELEEQARFIYRERLRAGEGALAVQVLSGTTGGRLS